MGGGPKQSKLGLARTIVLRAGLCLALGLVATVAVAWASAAWSLRDATPPWTRFILSRDYPVWDAFCGTSFGGERYWLYRHWDPGGDRREKLAEYLVDDDFEPWLTAWDFDPESVRMQSLIEDARGWPWLALAASCESESHNLIAAGTSQAMTARAGEEYSVRQGIVLQPRYASGVFYADMRMLPYRPIWKGLVLDTLFYSLLALGSVTALRFWRASRRRRTMERLQQGLCPNCGYDAHGVDESACSVCSWRGETLSPGQLDCQTRHARTEWKRWAKVLVLSLVLGILTTWIVTWAFSYYGSYLRGSRSEPWGSVMLIAIREGVGKTGWFVYAKYPPDFVGSDRQRALAAEFPPWSVSHPSMAAGLPAPPAVAPHQTEGSTVPSYLWTEVASGWPALCARGYCWHNNTETSGALLLHSSANSPPLKDDRNLLPYDPIWSGMLINVAFYGGIWCWLLLGIGFIQRRKRVRRMLRGRCPECRHDLRSDLAAGCPECGWGRDEPQQ
jgi:hypothetical protein